MSLSDKLAKGKILYHTGVPVLDDQAPDGFPRNAFGVIRGPGGGGKSVIMNEMVRRATEAGHKVIYVCFEDSPISILQNLVSLGWQHEKALENDLIELVDCFSSLILRRTPALEHTHVVRDPSNTDTITDTINSLIDRMGADSIAGIYLDSLTEFFVQSHPFKAVNAAKAWRATFCKDLNIPFWAVYHTGLQQFAAYDDVISYTSDVLIDTRHEPAFAKAGALVKQFRITKMKGARHIPVWVTFDVRSEGIYALSIDDLRETAKSLSRFETSGSEPD